MIGTDILRNLLIEQLKQCVHQIWALKLGPHNTSMTKGPFQQRLLAKASPWFLVWLGLASWSGPTMVLQTAGSADQHCKHQTWRRGEEIVEIQTVYLSGPEQMRCQQITRNWLAIWWTRLRCSKETTQQSHGIWNDADDRRRLFHRILWNSKEFIIHAVPPMRSQGSRVLELHFQNRPTIPISHAAPRLGRPDEHATPTSHLTRASRIAHVKQTTHAKFGFHDAKTSRQNPQDHDWQKRGFRWLWIVGLAGFEARQVIYFLVLGMWLLGMDGWTGNSPGWKKWVPDTKATSQTNVNKANSTAADMRPITIFSGMWGLVPSSLAKSTALQEWNMHVLDPSQYGGIKKRTLHQAIANIRTSYHQRWQSLPKRSTHVTLKGHMKT